MKKLYILMGVVLLMQACGGSSTGNENSSSAPSVGAVNMEGLELIDLPGGYQRAIRKNESGKITEEGVLRNGKRNGTWIVYHTDKPVPASVANFIDDQYSGPYLQYTPTGQLELACSYKANQLDGSFSKFKKNVLTEEGSYLNGQYHGSYTKYYPNKRYPQQVVEYYNGQLHGLAKYFNEAGDLIMEYEYNHGEKVKGGIVEKEATE